MGFSVSAVTAIVVGVLLVSATNMVIALDQSYSKITEKVEGQDLRQWSRLRTKMSFQSYAYNETAQELELQVENTGEISLKASEVEVLVNGELLETIPARTAVDNNTATDVWGVNEDLNLTVAVILLPPALSSLKVVAENGASTMYEL